jgi:hypothetical protein
MLAVLWGTDKAPGHHAYTDHYARHLRPMRRSARAVLEIGIGEYDDPFLGGNSLRMWRSYLPNATIYGVDIYEKRFDPEPRLVTLQADQSDPASLRRIFDTCATFDVIVDDGSHVGSDIITSFSVLFPSLRVGGLYVIEDLETAYWPDHGGGPPGTAGTAVALVQSLIDEVNVGPRPVAAVHAYNNIVFIEKG